MSDTRPPRLVVGLGNPGGEYADTRHNVGFMAVDILASDAGTSFDTEKRWKTQIAKTGSHYLLKPQTYMNESGVAVGKVASFYKIDPDEILVIYDELELPLGRMRIRAGGSAGGHNGMKSLIAHLGTDRFPRLRLGIGRQGGSTGSHVLGKFRDDERSELEKSLKNAVLATALIASEGISAAMTRYNSIGKPPKKKRAPKPAPTEVPEDDAKQADPNQTSKPE